MDIKKTLKSYFSQNSLDKKAIKREIIADKNLLSALFENISGEYARQSTRILADISQKIQNEIYANLNILKPLLHCNDPKVRMHTGEIIGNNAAEICLDNLIDTLNKENVYYVLPSLLLAIGKAKCDKAKNYLTSYSIKSDSEKHINAEKSALYKALSNFETRKQTAIHLLPDDTLYIDSPNLLVTQRTFNNAGFNTYLKNDFIIINNAKNYGDIFKVRSFSTAYIYLGKSKLDVLPDYLNKIEDCILKRISVLKYRFEVKNIAHTKRKDLIKQCVKSFDTLRNSPSSYSFEIMIYINKDIATVFLNPLNDTRFKYKTKTIAASIAPNNAACILEFASRYINPKANVLDNFCGSGTMLLERSFYPYKSLTGIDNNDKAINAAKINAANVKNKLTFITGNILNYNFKKYDEIITNMPFGHRVGNHSQNIYLYKKYMKMLPNILCKNGIAILYTQEKKLIEELAVQNKFLKIIDKKQFNAGGFTPNAYVIVNEKH